MQKVSIILGAGLLALLSGHAFAFPVTATDGPPPVRTVSSTVPGGGGDGGGTPCVTLCEPLGDPDGPGNPDNPNNPKSALNLALKGCGDRLSHLGRVTVGDVRSINGEAKVKVVPVCEYRHGSLTQPQLKLLDRGNVGGLGNAIATNPTLVSELGQHRYDANDVIGIALVKGPGAVLFVHRQ